jgi:hypothetical protein
LTPSNWDSSAAITFTKGWMLRHAVRQLVPGYRAIPAT